MKRRSRKATSATRTVDIFPGDLGSLKSILIRGTMDKYLRQIKAIIVTILLVSAVAVKFYLDHERLQNAQNDLRNLTYALEIMTVPPDTVLRSTEGSNEIAGIRWDQLTGPTECSLHSPANWIGDVHFTVTKLPGTDMPEFQVVPESDPSDPNRKLPNLTFRLDNLDLEVHAKELALSPDTLTAGRRVTQDDWLITDEINERIGRIANYAGVQGDPSLILKKVEDSLAPRNVELKIPVLDLSIDADLGIRLITVFLCIQVFGLYLFLMKLRHSNEPPVDEICLLTDPASRSHKPLHWLPSSMGAVLYSLLLAVCCLSPFIVSVLGSLTGIAFNVSNVGLMAFQTLIGLLCVLALYELGRCIGHFAWESPRKISDIVKPRDRVRAAVDVEKDRVKEHPPGELHK